MYSKILLLLLTMAVVSCSYFFDEKQKKSNTYDLSINEKSSVNCIEQNKQLLSDYFELKRSNEEIVIELNKMNTCINDAILLFVKHTKGAEENSYTAIEIHNFLSQVFDSYSYGPKFLEDVVLLKDSLMGGTQYKITKAEVRALPQYVNFFYQSLAELAPERHLLFSQRTGDDWEQFNVASKKLESIAARFKKLPNKSTGTFDYLGMVRIAETLIGDEDSHWHKTFDLINTIQAILVNGEKNIVKSENVAPIVENLATLYLSYMEFNKFVRDNAHCEKNDKECLDKGFFRDFAAVFIFPALVTRLVDYPDAFNGKVDILASTQMKVLKTLRSAFTKTGGVSMSYIYDLIATLSRIEALPEFIKTTTLVQMAPQFFGFWLSKKPCLVQRCEETVIGAEQVDTLIQLVEGWQERQNWITKAMTSRKIISRPQMRTALKKSGNITSNLIDFQDALEQVQHAHWTNYVHIGSKELTYKDLLIFNKLFTLVKLFLSPFHNNASQADVVNYYLTQSQVQYFYQWFRPLGLELKLIDPRSRTSGKQAFIEINLFGSSSTKADQMDFAELIEYFEIALSTGSRTDDLMLQKFSECRIAGAIDVFYYEKRTPDCFRQEFVTNANDYFFSTMPQLNKYFKDIPTADYPRLIKALEKAGRQGVVAETDFDTDSVRVMSSISQYSESLFLRFEDPNDDDQVISGQELQNILAHIVPNLKQLIKDNLDDKEVNFIYKLFPNFEVDLITYVLHYSKVPDILSAVTVKEQTAAAVQLKTWSNGLTNWYNGDPKASRESVMTVISGLSAFARASKVKGIRKILVANELELKKGFIGDPENKIFYALAEELSCSTLKDLEVRQWLAANQDKYFKDALQYYDIKFLGFKFELSKNDLPQTGVFAGWEGTVVTALVTLIAQDPAVSNYCNVPFLTDVHKITEE